MISLPMYFHDERQPRCFVISNNRQLNRQLPATLQAAFTFRVPAREALYLQRNGSVVARVPGETVIQFVWFRERMNFHAERISRSLGQRSSDPRNFAARGLRSEFGLLTGGRVEASFKNWPAIMIAQRLK